MEMFYTLIEDLQRTVEGIDISTQALALSGLAAGIMLLFLALASLARKPTAVVRMQAGAQRMQSRGRADLVQHDNFDLGGLLRAFVPSSQSERTRIARRMRKAGITRSDAVYIYYVVRALFGVALPAAFVGLWMIPTETLSFLPVAPRLNELNLLTVFQIAVALSVAGFYGPVVWLTARIQDRRERIRLGLPNALDFLQISIEAGLGFDAAILRVSRELSTTAPDIAQEFMMMELEIQAGKDRDAAFLEMADRCDIDEMKSFANVILQATHFGSSVATALTTYAKGLRQDRELRAQEKANRLPVQMSAVIALCMMPVLLMICLGPMLIRWITVFG